MTITTIISKHFHGAAFIPEPGPALRRLDDQTLLGLMRNICAARPAARAASSTRPAAQAMIDGMTAYQAELLNTCMFSQTDEAAAYRQARQAGNNTLLEAELAVLRNAGDKKLLTAFETMISTGQHYLNTRPDPNLLSRIKACVFR